MVLIILAILAAIAIPAMMGFIQKARDQSLISEARVAYAACQTVAEKASLAGEDLNAPM